MSEIKKWFLSLNTKFKILLISAGAVVILAATLMLVFLLPKPEKLKITATDITLQINETKVLNNYSVNNSSAVIKFETDDDLVEISNFHVKGIKAGSAQLTIVARIKNEVASCSCVVTILPNEPDVQEEPSTDNQEEEHKNEPANPEDNKTPDESKPSGKPSTDENPTEDENPNDSQQEPGDGKSSTDDGAGGSDANKGDAGDSQGDAEQGDVGGNSGGEEGDSKQEEPKEDGVVVEVQVSPQDGNSSYYNGVLQVSRGEECFVKITINVDEPFTVYSEMAEITAFTDLNAPIYLLKAIAPCDIQIKINDKVVATIRVEIR